MHKKLLIFLSLLLFSSSCIANPISKHIKQSDFENDTKVALYVVDNDTKKVLFSKNETMPLNPASTIKALIAGIAYQVLGEDYNFETSLLKDNDDNYYLKLGGDIYLNQKDLNKLFANLKDKKINNIYIDDSIFAKESYPDTWLEEDKWPLISEISPYIINSNTVEIGINRSSLSKKVEVIQNDDYKLPIINELKLGEVQDIKIAKLYGENSSIINLQGYVASDDTLAIPVLKPEINFNVRINEALKKNDIVYHDRIGIKKAPVDTKNVDSVSRPLGDIMSLILYNSDNYASEILFRVTASKYFNKTATLNDSIDMFNKMYGYLLLKNEQIADGSGVSRQNNLSVKTIYEILNKISTKVDIYSLLPSANEGTMAERLLFLHGNLKAKTGSMRNQSSLIAKFNTRKNTNISFVSIVQDSQKRKPLLKHYENSLLGIIYKNY